MTITRGNRRELPHAAPIHLLSWTLPTYNPVFVVFYGVYLVLGPFIVERDPGPLALQLFERMYRELRQ